MKQDNLQNQIDKTQIPKYVIEVCENLSKNGFDSYLVGGCVRDLFLERLPKDWDITTNATPSEIIEIFGEEDTVYENKFGTVGVKVPPAPEGGENTDPLTSEKGINTTPSVSLRETASPREANTHKAHIEGTASLGEAPRSGEGVNSEGVKKIIEVTTYRKEGEYKDFRKPEKVEWGESIEEDLERRDFTMNALAFDPIKNIFVDIFKGVEDIKNKIINCVGNAEERFNEDALRAIRAIRFSAELNFVVGAETLNAIFKLADNLAHISKERIRDEFTKIIMSKNPMTGLLMCQKLGILKYISKDLNEAVGIEQNGHHTYDVFEHSLRALNHAAEKNYDLETRLASLFHDIGKPKTRRFDETKKDFTFYGHEVVGERIAKKILEDLKFEKKVIEKVSKLVRFHMFFSDPEAITLSSVRRLIVNIGKENIWDLINVRICDRMGSGTKKEEPWRLRKFESMIEEALRDPISLKTLKINGEKIMDILNEKPGKKIGIILNALFEEVIDDAEKNNEEYLKNRTLELNKLSEKELQDLAVKGKEKMQNKNEEELGEIKKKFRV